MSDSTPVPHATANPVSPPDATAAYRGPVEILLVDDRPENLLALEAILEPLNQKLVRAHSGDEALRKLLRHDVAVILLDVQMPGINGFETARIIKSRERTRYIPIIFLTAISKEEEYVFEGYSVGAVDYLAKPFQPDILRSKVNVFVDLYLKQKQLSEQQQLLRASERRELELKHRLELTESEARFSEIVESAMDAIIVFDTDGRVSLFNAAAERMFGIPTAQAVGRDVERVLPGPARRELLERLCQTSAAGEDSVSAAAHAAEHVISFTGLRANGERFPVEATASCLDVRGRRTFTLIARDISERRRAEAALQAQAESLARAMTDLKALNDELADRQAELERAMAARSRFYASMSHELRTPINAVLGYSTLLLENIYGPLNEKQAEGITRTHKAAKHLLELVNDVLDLSKIEAGKIDLRPQPVHFPALIEDLFVTVRPLADQYGSQLTLEHEGPPVTVTSDPRRLRQILLNLLSNAIKFGKGQPIRVRSLPRDDGGMLIEVIDRGEGIAPADQEKIFDEFVQLGKTQLTEGTGLGLPISRRLAEMLQGDLEVSSELGAGSVFRLVLPESSDAATPHGARRPSPSDVAHAAS
ncbi:MAG TPA: ATP-binding protein [Gemmatimonadaceae bacterium]|jgi:PAS domain S-box-containing protein|nr:ATP-binding protein [Gemmatimonadaceae bacterium]